MAKPARKAVAPAAVRPIEDRLAWALLGLIQVVCPLLFFTNLTRNPYFTQIAILNVGLALVGVVWAVRVWRAGEWRWPAVPVNIPLAAFLVAALASTILSYHAHTAVRPGIFNEGVRVWVFTIVNGALVFYLPLLFVSPLDAEPRSLSIWSDIVLALVWGAAWLGFYSMRNPDPMVLFWDPYGGFLWILAMVYAVLRTRRGEAVEFFHVILVVAMLAALYGLLQYWGRDMIWSNPIAPYGGRPVSTFGNPNFLSSHLMMLSPVALGFALRAKGRERWGYVAIAAILALGVLCTLTRSTYVGLLAAYLVMAALLFPIYRKEIVRLALGGAGIFVLLVLIFPHTPITSTQSPLSRFTEIFEAAKTGASYGPWDQRVLIWASAWDMAKLRPLFGMGWGCFELFFPFFQGKWLLVERYVNWRTHANNAHNILMELWSQTGMIGTGLALWMLVVMVVGGWFIVRRQSKGTAQTVAAGLLAGIIGMVVDNFFGNVSIFFAVPAFLFWWNAGALFSEGRAPAAPRPVSPIAGRPLLGVIAGVLLACSLYYVQRMRQELAYFEGFKESKANLVMPSIKSLERAVAAFPSEVNTDYELGNSYARQAKASADRGLKDDAQRFHERAAHAYEMAMNSNPGYDELYFNLGVTLVQLGRTDEAIARLERAVFINPLLKDAYTSLGNVYLTTKHADEATRVFDQGVAVFPKDAEMWNNLGYSLSQQGKNEEAFQAYKRAVTANPGFQPGWQNLATSAATLKKMDPILEVPGLIKDMETSFEHHETAKALASAQRLAAILPENADAQISLANALFYAGRRADSEKAYRRAIELKPDFGVAHLNLGRLLQAEGRNDEARAAYQQALALNPNDADAKAALASLPRS